MHCSVVHVQISLLSVFQAKIHATISLFFLHKAEHWIMLRGPVVIRIIFLLLNPL